MGFDWANATDQEIRNSLIYGNIEGTGAGNYGHYTQQDVNDARQFNQYSPELQNSFNPWNETKSQFFANNPLDQGMLSDKTGGDIGSNIAKDSYTSAFNAGPKLDANVGWANPSPLTGPDGRFIDLPTTQPIGGVQQVQQPWGGGSMDIEPVWADSFDWNTATLDDAHRKLSTDKYGMVNYVKYSDEDAQRLLDSERSSMASTQQPAPDFNMSPAVLPTENINPFADIPMWQGFPTQQQPAYTQPTSDGTTSSMPNLGYASSQLAGTSPAGLEKQNLNYAMSQLGMMSGGYNTGSYNPYVPTDASADDYIDSSISGDMNIGTPSSFDPSSDSSSDSGSFYNPDFGSDFGTALSGNQDLGSMGYFQSTPGLFDFGDKPLFGEGLQTPKWTGDALKGLGLAGYDTTGIRQGLSLANLTPNSAFDIAASYTGNPYLGMLNDDFSQRGLVNKGLNFAGVPYSGSIMGAIDYSQGKNNWGALGQTVGAIAGATPVGMLGSYLLGNYLGDEYGSKWNENLTGPARDFADTHGLEPGTDDFDQAIDLFVHTMNDPKATQEQKDLVNFYMEDYKNQKFDPEWFGDKVMPSNWMEGKWVEPETLEEALAERVPFGKEGDASWSPDGKTVFHSKDYDWNNKSREELETELKSFEGLAKNLKGVPEETFYRKAQDAKKAEKALDTLKGKARSKDEYDKQIAGFGKLMDEQKSWTDKQFSEFKDSTAQQIDAVKEDLASSTTLSEEKRSELENKLYDYTNNQVTTINSELMNINDVNSQQYNDLLNQLETVEGDLTQQINDSYTGPYNNTDFLDMANPQPGAYTLNPVTGQYVGQSSVSFNNPYADSDLSSLGEQLGTGPGTSFTPSDSGGTVTVSTDTGSTSYDTTDLGGGQHSVDVSSDGEGPDSDVGWEDPNAGSSDSSSSSSSSSSDSCFVTTATLQEVDTKDDGKELTTFRDFRDNYLKNKSYGPALVRDYYNNAPRVVAEIDSRQNHKQLYQSIWKEHLRPINRLIEKGEEAEATSKYMLMMEELKEKFLPNKGER